MKKQPRRTNIIIALCVLVVVSGLSLSHERMKKEESFIDLFVQVQKAPRGSVVSGAAKGYILRCCEGRDEAVALLKKNGFKIHTRIWEEGDPYPSGFKEQRHYDETILGVRGTSLWRFWAIFTRYRVTLFISEGKVARVDASVRSGFKQ